MRHRYYICLRIAKISKASWISKKIFMIKKLNLFVASFLIIANIAQAQTDAEVLKTKKSIFSVNNQYKKPSKDYVMIQTGFNSWALPSGSNINLKQRGHEINAYICYDFPFVKKNFSFAAGAGIASSNVFLDSMTLHLTDTSKYATFVNSSAYKRNKLSLNYFEVPFEFRYFGNTGNRNQGFKASIGVRVGALVNAHTKSVVNLGAGNYKDKESSRRFFETWRLMNTARIGWGNFSLYGAYQITEVFKVNNSQGIGVRPFSFGLCISGL
jgi:hypothetical protein